MFIILLNYKVPISEVEKVVEAHRAYLKKEGFDKGLIITAGPRVPRTGGLIVFNSSDSKQAEDFVANDPFMLEGIADFEIIQFNPVLLHLALV